MDRIEIRPFRMAVLAPIRQASVNQAGQISVSKKTMTAG
jgi:hypothetical protein